VTSSTSSESEAFEPARPSATIIAFPTRPAPVAAPPEDRLTRALAALNAAMMEQRAAVEAWRRALGELKATTAGLDDSLQRYRGKLRSLDSSVSALQAKARSLEQWADGVAAD
jgi:hypothetical protein